MAAAANVDADRWQQNLSELLTRVGARFARVEPRLHTRSLVLGLLAGLPRSNCWTLAEHAGHATPKALQHLLAAASWDGTVSVETCAATSASTSGTPTGCS